MNHYVIVRFNLPWKSEAENESWISNRIKLFETYLLKTLSRQKNKSFTLDLCINANTPSKFIEKLSKKIKSAGLKSRFLKFQSMQEFKDTLKDNYKKGDVLTRIDSDDVVSSDYIDNIQKFYKKNKGKNICYDYLQIGYLDTAKKDWSTVVYKATTMFLTIEFNGKHTPYSCSHDLIRKLGFSVYKSDNPNTCCVCHGTNLANDLERARKRFSHKKDINYFSWFGD